MHKKITRFARGAKCGALGASGPTRGTDVPAAAARAARPAKARYPKPLDSVFSIARREKNGDRGSGEVGVAMWLPEEAEVGARKEHAAEGSPRRDRRVGGDGADIARRR